MGIIEGKVSAFSRETFGIKIGEGWYNVAEKTESIRKLLETLKVGDTIKLVLDDNGKYITFKIVETTKPIEPSQIRKKNFDLFFESMLDAKEILKRVNAKPETLENYELIKDIAICLFNKRCEVAWK